MKLTPVGSAKGAGNPLLRCESAGSIPTGSIPMTRRRFVAATGGAIAASAANSCGGDSSKRVVLTFDDAVKSHRTFVAPLLKDLGFNATFYVTHRWMDDAENFMTWEDIAEIHEMGFEIGNHTWTHSDASIPRTAGRFAGELALVENALEKVGVPRPTSLAWCGNSFGPEALGRLRDLGYRFARRGKDPEGRDRTLKLGLAYDPRRHDSLLIPSTAVSILDWDLAHLRAALALGEPGKLVVLQFHGVPDVAHPWVDTRPDMFRQYMELLKNEGYETLAVRDLERFVDPAVPVDDPLAQSRIHPGRPTSNLSLPVEIDATQADIDYWMESMLGDHRYTPAEAALVSGLSEDQVAPYAAKFSEALAAPGLQSPGSSSTDRASTDGRKVHTVKVRPYPGGRHPRIGFLEGAIDPQRGTKASVFLPWDPSQYVVVDLPEAIFSNLGLLYLAHTHVPTIWNDQNVVIENVDWERLADGGLRHQWELPNKVSFGASIQPARGQVDMELWLRNGTDQPLTKLRTQICVMLKGASGFNEQTLDNKIFREPVAAVRSAAVRSADGNRWIFTAWQRTGRSWGNLSCPCFHADPVFPDCAPGETVRLKGRLWFYEGVGIEAEIARAAAFL